MKKLKPREWILIVVPLLLLAIAVTLQFRPQWNNVFKPRFYIENAQPVELTPFEVAQGYDTKCEIVLNHSWPRPRWWNAQNGWTSTTNPTDYVAAKNGQKMKAPGEKLISVQEPRYDKNRDRYVAIYKMSLAKVPRTSSELVLHGNLAVGMFETGSKPISPVVAVRQTVRRAKALAMVPTVSRAHNLVPYKAIVTLRTAAQTRANGGLDPVVRLVFRRINNAAFDKGAIASQSMMVDENGLPAVEVGQKQSSLRNASRHPELKLKQTGENQFYFEQSELLFWKSRPKTLRIVGYATLHGAWPVGFVTTFDLPPALTTATKPLTMEVPIKQRALKRGALFEYSP